MDPNLSGGCACGAIRYQVKADPLLMLNCHCRDCQRATGSAYAPVVAVPKAAVELSGELRYHRAVGEDGYAVERGFCPTCGSQVVSRLERMPEILGLLAGNLDDPALHKPEIDMFTSSAQAWDHMRPDTRKYPKGLAP